jgi:hypothetical protein
MRSRRPVALVGLVGIAGLLFLGAVPALAATPPTAAACQALADQYGGIAGTPNTTFFPGSPGTPPIPTVTDGEVVQLFQQICPTSAFGQAFAQHGGTAFVLGESGDAKTGSLVVEFTFEWRSSCPPALASSGECTFQEYWDGWPANNTTAGPSTYVGASVCACGASLDHASLNVPLVVGLGAAVGAAGVVVVVAWRHRRPRPPNGVADETANARDPPTERPPGPRTN